MYYAEKSRDGHVYCVKMWSIEEVMYGDYLLFDTVDDCVNYWRGEGIIIDRFI